jgi:hypothetical protein
MNAPRKQHYVELRSYSRNVQIALAACVAMNTLMAIYGSFQSDLVVREDATHPEGFLAPFDFVLWQIDHADPVARIVLLGVSVSLIAGAITFLHWLYLARRNLVAFNVDTETPDKAIAYWFIPGTNLFLPVVDMYELHKHSNPVAHTAYTNARCLIGLWWASWLGISLWAGSVNLCRAIVFAVTPSLQIASSCEFVVFTVSALLLQRIVSDITSNQHKRHHMMMVAREPRAEQPQVAGEGEIIRTPVMEPEVKNA